MQQTGDGQDGRDIANVFSDLGRSKRNSTVLGDSFVPENVSSVPCSRLLNCCLIVQVRATPSKRTGGASNQASEERAESKPGQRIGDKMKTTDKSRKWMWWLLGVMGAMQLYFVRELLAAFALFVLGFAAIALVIAALY